MVTAASARKHRRKKRWEVISKLGGVCAGCGCDEFVALTLDHIHGGGCAHRRTLGKRTPGKTYEANSTVVYNAVLEEGLPRDKYRILCWNCQHKAKIGYPLPTEMADPRLVEVGA